MPGAKHIVLHTLYHIVFDQRHVLIGSGVIHRMDTKRPHRGLATTPMAYITKQRMQFYVQPLNLINGTQFPFNGVEGKLGLLKQHQNTRTMANNLAAQLGTD